VLLGPPSQVLAEEQREDLKIMGRSYTIAFNAEMDKPGRVISDKVRCLDACFDAR